MKNLIQQGALFAALAGVCWGTTGTAQAMLPSETPPLTLGAVRLLIGGLVFFLLLFWRGKLKGSIDWRPREILIASIGLVGLQVGLFSALPRTGVAIGTMVTIGSSPIVAGILGKLFYREKLTIKWMVATGLAIVGCALIILSGTKVKVDLTGIFLALMGGSFYALCGLGVKGLTKSRSLLPNIAAMIVLGSIFLLLISLGNDYSWVFSISGIGVGLYIGIIATIVPYGLFAWALQRIPLAQTYTFGLTEPLVAFLLGVFFLKESIQVIAMTGVLILLGGLVWLALPD